VVFLLAMVPVLAGLVVTAVGLLGHRERLRRNRFLGVRTAATLRGEDTFRLANKVAAPPTVVAGLVGVLGGLAALLMPTTGGLVAAVVIATAGLLAITAGAGVLGHRAALALPEPKAEVPAGCAGCQCGGTCLRSGNR
jgi:hypothetical protein